MPKILKYESFVETGKKIFVKATAEMGCCASILGLSSVHVKNYINFITMYKYTHIQICVV